MTPEHRKMVADWYDDLLKNPPKSMVIHTGPWRGPRHTLQHTLELRAKKLGLATWRLN